MLSFCKFLLFIIISYFGLLSYAQKVTSPVVLKADVVKYDANFEGISAHGNVYVTMDSYVLTADSLYYDLKKDVLFAEGNIRIKDEGGKIILGQKAILKDKLKKGIIDEFTLKLPDGSILVAASAKRQDAQRVHLHKASFTPCKITCRREPIWQIKAQETDVDYNEERIKYKNMFFEVYGIPVIIFPYFSHPTPTAPAQSGILVPHIKDNNLVIPFYFRAKSNIDFTLSPRLTSNYTIIEGQFRHLLKDGSYEINASSGNPSFEKGSKDSKPGRYHIFAKGDFLKNDLNYGFDINRTSDKAYLTNYFAIYDSYLESRFYANKIDAGEYASIEAYSYQGLRAQDKKSTTPLIFPRIRNQKIIGLNDDETILFKVKNDAIAYNESFDKQLARNALELALSTNIITSHGHLFNFALSNRNDLYLYSFTDPSSKLNKEKTWNRNIPELQAKWRYPLIRYFSNISVKLEPIIAAFVGVNYSKRFDKFALVDVAKYELSEYNLFSANRFSGIDYHDYGKRLSYGLNTSLFSDPYYFDIFLGQLVYQNNIVTKGNSEYVGNTSFDIASNLKLYYRFRKNEKFKSIRDEVGISTTTDKLTTNLGFSRLNNISRYYADDMFNFPANKISQINFNVGYQIFESLKIGVGALVDTTKKTQLLHRSILVTYAMDCVSITGKFYDDYTHDSTRGVRKNSTKTFAVGLKVLNM